MNNLSEKTEELLRATGVKDIKKFEGWSTNDIYLYFCWNMEEIDDRRFTMSDVDTAAEEIAEALKQKEQ